MADLLTVGEHGVMTLLAEVANRMTAIIGWNSTPKVGSGDLDEMVFYIHGLQHMVMAQAAARAYPEQYRLLGRSLHG